MNLKLNGIAAAMFSAGLLVAGPSAMAQTVDGQNNCDQDALAAEPFQGLGSETCTQPNPYPGEGVLFTAAEQVVSLISAIADDIGCPAVQLGGSISVSINPNLNPGFPQSATTSVGGAQFQTTEVVNTEHYSSTGAPYYSNGVRVHRTVLSAPGKVVGFGDGLTSLSGQFNTDGPYSIMYGNSDFTNNGDNLDEHVIKDFYQGVVRDPSEVPPNNTASNTRLIRDNGLEVTTKKYLLELLIGGTDQVSHPKGKWRQTSFYRGPDGGNGKLTMTKVRIAPFGAAECALQLTGTVTNNLSFPVFSGAVSVFPLASSPQ